MPRFYNTLISLNTDSKPNWRRTMTSFSAVSLPMLALGLPQEDTRQS